jgi:hypothetical protein
MRYGYTDRGPAWWLLYAIGLLLAAAIGLVEVKVPDGGLREVLESFVVIGGFGLMVMWVRFNREAMDLHRGGSR